MNTYNVSFWKRCHLQSITRVAKIRFANFENEMQAINSDFQKQEEVKDIKKYTMDDIHGALVRYEMSLLGKELSLRK